MKLSIRRIGNSLGVIVPRKLLSTWGLEEGDVLEANARGITPTQTITLSHDTLDRLKRSIALAVVSRFTPRQIRAQSLANLHRWREGGAWVSAYDEWKQLIEQGDDGALYAAMLGKDEQSNRLRQSPPYVGLLPSEEVRKLNEEAAS